MGNLIRLCRQHDELDFFLEPNDMSKIHNRITKFNVSMKTDNVRIFLGMIVNKLKAKIISGNGYQYHGEFDISKLSFISKFIGKTDPLTFFNPQHLWHIPKGYKFHEVGICLNNTPQDNEFGNVEIKFVKDDCVIVPNENPDFMIVINLHLVDHRYKNSNRLVFKGLGDERFHTQVNEFFNHRSLIAFNHDDDILKAGDLSFKPMNKESKLNLEQYKKLQNETVDSSLITTEVTIPDRGNLVSSSTRCHTK